ncbi:site-specific integrase, partial [Bacteriovoracaceae bacterium]|nr:site-specific integrase [Bacteriovoracaceae bacterium]
MIEAPDLSSRKGLSHRMVLVMLFTLGLRRSELINIKLKDFYTQRNHNVLRIKGKGNKDRHIPINEFVHAEIANYINGLNQYKIDLNDEDFLIQSQPKSKNEIPMDGSTVYRIVTKYKHQLGIIKRLSPHSCRATVISHLLDTQKTPIRDVAIFAGHSKITTTQRYDKRRKGLDDSAAYDVNYLKSKAES